MVSSLISYDSTAEGDCPSVYINISIHTPFDDLNRTLFSLFVCGSLTDPISGLTFALSNRRIWKFFIEIPYSTKHDMPIMENLNYLLPLLAIVAQSSIDIVTDEDYQLYIGKEEELVARFLKAYSNGTIDRRPSTRSCVPYEFEALNDKNECREHIYDCIDKLVSRGRRNKIYEVSFTKFLYRRVRFFTNFYYTLNEVIPKLGSIAMSQMIQEAKSLSEISFHDDNYPRLYLIYDPDFALHLLHNNWDEVPTGIKTLWKDADPLKRPEFLNRNHFLKCLSWLVNTKYETCERIMNQMKFILTENFAYKLFHIHERKLTTLPLIIEGDTGIGKTYLLKLYSLLLNANIQHDYDQASFREQIVERANLWLSEVIFAKFLEIQPSLLNGILERLRPKLMGSHEEIIQDDDIDVDLEYSDDEENENNNQELEFGLHYEDDEGSNEGEESQSTNMLSGRSLQVPDVDINHDKENPIQLNDPFVNELESLHQRQSANRMNFELLKQCKTSFAKFEYNSDMLIFICQTILAVAQKDSTSITKQLLHAVRKYIKSELANLPLIEGSSQLKNLLENGPLNVRTSIQMLEEYISHSYVKSVFYRLLIHPGVTEQEIERFISPISELARKWEKIELVVFFDELNTSSCLGLFKEIFTDRTLQGVRLPQNIFFTAAINPALDKPNQDNLVHRLDYLVHELPKSLEHLKVSYGALEPKTLNDYITQKVARFDLNFSIESEQRTYLQGKHIKAILAAQAFCEEKLGKDIETEEFFYYIHFLQF